MTREMTPGDLVGGTADDIRRREQAIRSILNNQTKAPSVVTNYLRGYLDASRMDREAVEKMADSELMGEPIGEGADVETILADVLKRIWGSNPQAPVSELDVETLLERLVRKHGRDTVDAAVEQAGWAVEVPGGDG